MKYKKGKFIDKVFGEENEYIIIQQDKELIVIDINSDTIKIKKFKSIAELVEKYIEIRNEKDFLNVLVQSQNYEIDCLEKGSKQIS